MSILPSILTPSGPSIMPFLLYCRLSPFLVCYFLPSLYGFSALPYPSKRPSFDPASPSSWAFSLPFLSQLGSLEGLSFSVSALGLPLTPQSTAVCPRTTSCWKVLFRKSPVTPFVTRWSDQPHICPCQLSLTCPSPACLGFGSI